MCVCVCARECVHAYVSAYVCVCVCESACVYGICTSAGRCVHLYEHLEFRGGRYLPLWLSILLFETGCSLNLEFPDWPGQVASDL